MWAIHDVWNIYPPPVIESEGERERGDEPLRPTKTRTLFPAISRIIAAQN